MLRIATEWDEFRFIDWEKVHKEMRKPAWLFDTRSIVDVDLVNKSGINFWSIGRG